MWPWEHLAVGYVAVSLAFRLAGRPVGDDVALATVLGSQFPDLIDKPLAWSVAVLPSGTSLAHSVFVAVPLGALVVAFGYRRGKALVGVAFVLAYLLHLPGDALYDAVTVGEPPSWGAILWPVVQKPPGVDPGGLIGETLSYGTQYLSFLATPAAARYLALEGALLLAALGLWLLDGKPGIHRVWTRARQVTNRW